jgi:hypothetical protein
MVEVIANYNVSLHNEAMEAWIDDATWILTSSFIIFTMQSGKTINIISFIFHLSL